MLQRQLLPHAESCSRWAGEFQRRECDFEGINISNATIIFGLLYADQGRLGAGEAMYQRVLSGFQIALEPSHQKLQMIIRNIEHLRQAKGILDA